MRNISLHSKLESISQSLQVILKMFQEREIKTNETFHQSITFLQNDLLTKNETIRSLTEIQTTILEAPFKCNQQYEGNQTNLLTGQKQHQSQQQKPIHHSKHNKCLQNSDKDVCHDQKIEHI